LPLLVLHGRIPHRRCGHVAMWPCGHVVASHIASPPAPT
jgi:hypothetical protein